MTSATQRICKRLRIVGNRGSITVLRDRREESVATITLLLQRVREGEQTARDSLFELAYNNLKGLARSRLRSDGRGGQQCLADGMAFGPCDCGRAAPAEPAVSPPPPDTGAATPR